MLSVSYAAYSRTGISAYSLSFWLQCVPSLRDFCPANGVPFFPLSEKISRIGGKLQTSERRRKCPRGAISIGMVTGLPDESLTVNVAFCVLTLSVSRLLNVALKSAVSVSSSGSSDPNKRSVRRVEASFSSAVTGAVLSFFTFSCLPSPPPLSPFGAGDCANDTALTHVSATNVSNFEYRIGGSSKGDDYSSSISTISTPTTYGAPFSRTASAMLCRL